MDGRESRRGVCKKRNRGCGERELLRECDDNQRERSFAIGGQSQRLNAWLKTPLRIYMRQVEMCTTESLKHNLPATNPCFQEFEFRRKEKTFTKSYERVRRVLSQPPAL